MYWARGHLIFTGMNWSIDKARERYNITAWGEGYFDISPAGHLVVRPRQLSGSPEIDLRDLVDDVHESGLSLPVLVRFIDILYHRLDRLYAAFQGAIGAQGYGGTYTAVYPIKVNQQQHVVRGLAEHGGPRVGFEAGSKPELLAILAVSPPGGVIVCNGYKDAEYIQLALMAERLGHRTFIVIEKLSELELVIRTSMETGMRPRLGMRIRLASVTAGNWQDSGGERSKFGFTSNGVLAMQARLREAGMEDCLRLLHCHPGSQIASISALQRALEETSRYYAQLREAGFPVDIVDVGGGLGVDYTGTASKTSNSVDYDIDEYASAVVATLGRICREQDLPHPGIITESGRALTAHHAVLITNVVDGEQVYFIGTEQPAGADEPVPVAALRADLLRCSPDNALAVYDDAGVRLADLHTLFIAGDIELQQRALGESLYYAVCHQVQSCIATDPQAHGVLDEVNRKLADKYFLNLSVFQSMPDVWAIDQIFPIMPLHRLDEVPDRRGILHDLTCDSDGHIEYYVDSAGIESSLPLHAIGKHEPYLLGIFLLGAYQEILGDLHNLFGDTDAVNVELDENGGYRLVEPRHGDTVEELLRYVDYDPGQIKAGYREKVLRAGLSEEERETFLHVLESGLEGYTYLEDS